MSENTDQTEGELFATGASEENPETGSTTDELNLDGEETNGVQDPAQANKSKQIAVWQARVDAGEVKVEDIPHKWIQDGIKTKKVQSAVLDEDLLEKKLVEREQRKAFDARYNELKSLPLTKAHKDALNREFKALSNGPKDLRALEAAIRLANLPDFIEEQRRLAGTRMPSAGRDSTGSEIKDIEQMTEDEILADSEALRTKRFGPPKI